MKVNLSNIYKGNIEKITKSKLVPTCMISFMGIGGAGIGHIETKTTPYKEDAYLIKIRAGLYVDLENTKSLLGRIKLKRVLTLADHIPIKIDGKFIMDNTEGFVREGDLVVKYDTVKSVYSESEIAICPNKELGKIRKELNKRDISR